MKPASPSQVRTHSTSAAAEPDRQLLASRRHTVRLILITCGIAFIGFIQNRRAAPVPIDSRLPLYLSIVALQLLLVWFIRKGIRVYGHSLGSLFGRSWRTLLDPIRDAILATLFVFLLRVCAIILRQVLGTSPHAASLLLPQTLLEIILWIGVALVAGIGEEIVYRGYLQPQLRSLTGNLGLAVVLQAIVFALAHLYQGWRPVLIIFVYGLAFGLLAAWRKSIIPGIIAHSLIDVIGGLFPK